MWFLCSKCLWLLVLLEDADKSFRAHFLAQHSAFPMVCDAIRHRH
jgi:hypothetical protein